MYTKYNFFIKIEKISIFYLTNRFKTYKIKLKIDLKSISKEEI